MDVLIMAVWIVGIPILSIYMRVVIEKSFGMNYDYQASHAFVSLNISVISLFFVMAYFRSRVEADSSSDGLS